MLPHTGSTITAAIRWPCRSKAASRAAGSLYFSTRVSRAVPSVTPGELGTPKRGRRTARRHQQTIDVAVIVAGELDDHRPAGVSAGQADGAHGRLGARVDQADLFHRRDGRGDQFRQLRFGQRGGAEAGAAADGLFQRRRDRRMGVTKDHRPPGADVIEVAIAVDIDQVGPFGVVDEDRLAADRAERPGRAVHAPGDELFRAGEGRRGSSGGTWRTFLASPGIAAETIVYQFHS